MGQSHEARRQGLPQGGGIALGPIAPLVEPCPGGIQVKLRLVVHNGKLELVQVPVLRQPGNAVLLPQVPGGGLFHNGLTVRHRVELAVQAVALHREAAVFGNIVPQRRL